VPAARVVLTSGPDAGRRSFLALPGGAFGIPLEAGDRIRVARNEPSASLEASVSGVQPLAFVDFERGRALLALVVVFAALVALFGRWQGLRSLIGLGVALSALMVFVLPALLEGKPALPTAIVAALAVMLATMTLTHGLGLKSGAAILGTAARSCSRRCWRWQRSSSPGSPASPLRRRTSSWRSPTPRYPCERWSSPESSSPRSACSTT